MTIFQLDILDLSALMCSKVCHDVISPVGAIINGLEVLDENADDPEMRAFAMDLVKRSAETASAKLQFCRLAFGAAGSAGAMIDTGDAEKVTRGLIENEKTKLIWDAPRVLMAKNKVKVLLNLCLIASAAIPRGGSITVQTSGDDPEISMNIEARGVNARLASHVLSLLDGKPENGTVDAHSVQAYYTGLVARDAGLRLAVDVEPERIMLAAAPMPKLNGSAHPDETALDSEDAAA
ncbi:MAG: histidine phosphotransferase [Hyphomicrobiales bacterium]|nr:histidine phosphotransferase [Hyphomicrobiales bacterium]MDE2114353.1 histidine phosphotransferase [Hyphomicrobiales bacterium]